MAGDDPVQQREIAQAVEGAARQREIDARWTGHERQHRDLRELGDERWEIHLREHESTEAALSKALAAVEREYGIHAEAHQREHQAHQREHELNERAVFAAAASVDKRLEGMNEFRSQLRDQAATFASTERLDGFVASVAQRFADTAKHTDDRYEDNRKRIEAIEKGDVKSEGKQLGQGAVVAIIVTSIGVVGTVLAIIIALANVATGNP